MGLESNKISQKSYKPSISTIILQFHHHLVYFFRHKTQFSNFLGQNLKNSLDSSIFIHPSWLLKLKNIQNWPPKSWDVFFFNFCLNLGQLCQGGKICARHLEIFKKYPVKSWPVMAETLSTKFLVASKTRTSFSSAPEANLWLGIIVKL